MTASAPYFASPLRRLGGGLIDLGPLLLLFMVAVGILDLVAIKPAGVAFAAAVVLIAYYAGFLYYWTGETPGGRFVGIRAIGRSGDLTLLQCVGRPAFFVTFQACFFVIAIHQRIPWIAPIPSLADLFLMFILPTRQSVSDLIFRTFVVRTPPLQPHRAPAAPMFSATDAEFGVRPQRIERATHTMVRQWGPKQLQRTVMDKVPGYIGQRAAAELRRSASADAEQ